MKRNLTQVLLALALTFLAGREAYACHGVALVGFSATTNGSSVTVNGSSDSPTCGCGPYYMEVELACFSAANFTGLAPTCTAANWNVYPWYRSLLNVPNYTAPNWPDNCVVEPYLPVTINFSQLCPGTQYVLRARERVCGSGSAGPWSATYTFTTPGTPPSFTLTAAAAPNPTCPGNPVTLTATLSGTGGCGTGTPVFTWQPGNLIGQTVTVTPSTTTTYTVTATGGYIACYPVPPATVTVTVNATAIAGTASISPPTVCAGGCVTLTLTGNNGALQWQSSPNGITWTNIAGATTSPYVYCPVNAPMYFRAVVTGAPGCGTATSNTVTVGVTPVPTLTINPNAPSICAGQSVTLNVSGGSGYTWTGPGGYTGVGASVTITPSATGTYSVSTSGNCPGTQTVTITVNPAPVLVFSPPAPSICSGSSVTIDAGSNVNSYTWVPSTGLTYLSASQDSVLASPNSTTTYNVTATSPAGCTASGNVTVTVNPSPALILSDTIVTLCPNMTDTVTITGANSYTWNPLTGANILMPDGSQVEFNPASPTTYTVVGTSAAGCIDSAVVQVNISNNIVVDAGLPDSICPGTSTTLTATGGTVYNWTSNPASAIVNGNTDTPTVTPTVTTVYTVNVANQFGCTGSDSVTITVRNLPPADAGVDTSLCDGDAINLNATGGTGYSWVGPNITAGGNTSSPTIAPNASNNYIVTVTDQYGCTNTDVVNVTVHALPNANAGTDQFICGSLCANLLASGGTQYSWMPPIGLSSTNTAATTACPQMSVDYTVTVTDQYGCVNTDSVSVTVYPPLSVTASPAVAVCNGAQATISATAAGGDGGPYTYSWSPATGLSNPNAQSTGATPSATTTYTVTVTDACGSIAAIDSVTVGVFPVPVLNVTPDVTSGCSPVCVDFTGSSAPAAASWTYDFGDQSTSNLLDPSHCFTTPGSYTIIYTVTDVNGCTNTITYANMITVHPNPVAGFTVSPQVTTILAPDIIVTPTCTNCDTTHYFMENGLDSAVTTLNSQFTYTYSDTGYFQIMQVAVNQYGCVDTAYDYVIIQPDWSFFAPNAFTPNGDGINDKFYVYGEGIDNSTFEMWIFDRWGNTIFTSSDIAKGWDGTAQINGGGPVQIDTYVWRVKFRDINGNPHTYVGRVSVIR